MSRTVDARRPAGCSTELANAGRENLDAALGNLDIADAGFLNYDYTGDRPDVVYSVLLRRVTSGSREDDRTTRLCTSRRGLVH